VSQAFFVPGPLPGQNEMLNAHGQGGGGAGNGYAQAKKKWTNDIALLAKVHKIRPVERAHLRFVWHEKHRRRNPDNIAAGKKLVIDGLVKAGVLRNDGWDEVASFTDEWHVASPAGVTVFIESAVIDRANVVKNGIAANTAIAVPSGHAKDHSP
jgi:hypothetical protein